MNTTALDNKAVSRKVTRTGHVSKTGAAYISPYCTREHYWEYDVPARPHVKNCRACIREENLFVLSFPELAAEFDEERNGTNVEEVTIGNTKKVWWRCSKGNHEFQKTVNERIIAYGISCKECKHDEEVAEYNLASNYPEFASYYDEKKNGLKASEISFKSTEIVHWFCDEGHSYTCSVYTKIKNSSGCNQCARSRNQATKSNNLSVLFPELSKEFDSVKNGISAKNVLPGTAVAYSWKCHKGHQWSATPAQRVSGGKNCPECKVDDRGLVTLYPQIAEEFDITKNGSIPSGLLAGSSKAYWWKCQALGHEWKAKVGTRTRGNEGKGLGCPQCLHLVPSIEYNVVTEFPNIVEGYDETLNGKPLVSYLPGSTVKVWWKCENGHSKFQSIVSRTKNQFCPECPKEISVEAGKSLGELHPDVAKEFNVSKNGITANQIMSKSGRKMSWTCKNGHGWEATVASRVAGRGCPYCSGWKTDLSTSILTTHPDIAQWFDSKKNKVPVQEISAWSHKNVWWTCEHNHSYQQMPMNKIRQNDGCPHCSGRYASIGNNLLECHPELAAEFNEERNGFSAFEITPGSAQKVWWKCGLGHEWKTSVGDRNRTNLGERKTNKIIREENVLAKDIGCPYCAGTKVWKGFNDLAYLMPNLTKEFDTERNLFGADEVTTGTRRKAYWKCSKNHSWQASIYTRARKGMGCPECSKANSSKIEIAFRKALHGIPGWKVQDESNTKISVENYHRKSLMVDIHAEVDSQKVIIEYDGYYWHSGLFRGNREEVFERDMSKTKILLDNGYKVVRIREHNYSGKLDFLEYSHPSLFQLHHEYKGQSLDLISTVTETVEKIDNWIKDK